MINLYGGLILYAVAAGFAAWAIRTGDRRGLQTARFGAFCGAIDHIVFLVRVAARTGHFPVTGAIEAYIFLTTAIILLVLLLDWLKHWTVLVVATLPLAVTTTLLALALAMVPERAPAPAPTSSLWTSLHISTALGSYGAFALAFVSSILYLIAQRQLKDHAAASILGLIPSLETVARINRRSIAAGVALLAGGLLVGYFQMRALYGVDAKWWRNDPKIYLTTFTLAAYLLILALSGRPTFKGRKTALASVAGFVLVMATFWASVFWSDFHKFH